MRYLMPSNESINQYLLGGMRGDLIVIKKLSSSVEFNY